MRWTSHLAPQTKTISDLSYIVMSQHRWKSPVSRHRRPVASKPALNMAQMVQLYGKR
jgi:hypothetical protein